jgi:multidrug efflux system outer membrane protein
MKTLLNVKPVAGAAAALALLAGCSLAPTYDRPASPAPSTWQSGPAYDANAAYLGAQPARNVPWRDFFADARLRQVIELALANNRDLRVSALNIVKARAQYGVQKADLLPHISANAGESASRTPASASGISGVGGALTVHEYQANLAMASYELDFFGRVRSLSDAALQTYLATEEARNAQQISLVAETASDYLTLAADQERLRLAQVTLKSQQQSYELSQRRFQGGATSGLEMYQAQTSVETARADVGLYTSQVAQDINALTLVVGGAVPAELLPQGLAGIDPAQGTVNVATPAVAGRVDAVTALKEVPSGLPSEVLQRRPDVLEAERTLRGANANIGAARAAFFPQITLTASGGTASGNLSGLFKAGSSAWAFAPQISLPIFDAGINRANLQIAQAERDIALAQYEKAIQTAFREVSDALADHGTLDARASAQQALVDASAKSYRISEARYKTGADTYLNALVSQRALYTAQQGLISVRLSKAANLVALYKVMGGGWQSDDAALAAASADAR